MVATYKFGSVYMMFNAVACINAGNVQYMMLNAATCIIAGHIHHMKFL